MALHSSYPNVQVDYRKMFAALREVGYDHEWTYEIPWEQARAGAADYRHVVKSLAQ